MLQSSDSKSFPNIMRILLECSPFKWNFLEKSGGSDAESVRDLTDFQGDKN